MNSVTTKYNTPKRAGSNCRSAQVGDANLVPPKPRVSGADLTAEAVASKERSGSMDFSDAANIASWKCFLLFFCCRILLKLLSQIWGPL